MGNEPKIKKYEFIKTRLELITAIVALILGIISLLAYCFNSCSNNKDSQVNEVLPTFPNEKSIMEGTLPNNSFNGNIAGMDCDPVVGIALHGQTMQKGCAGYVIEEFGYIDRSYDVRLYYRNTSNHEAKKVFLGMKTQANGRFIAFLSSSIGGIMDSATLIMPENAYLKFDGARIYQRKGDNEAKTIKIISTLSELNKFSIPNLPSYTNCKYNSFCYQGVFVATFSVKSEL